MSIFPRLPLRLYFAKLQMAHRLRLQWWAKRAYSAALFMGGGTTPGRAIVQCPGHGFLLKAQWLRDEFNLAGPLMHLFLHYTQALITQMAQTAVCNRHHSLHQQLCRWLLMSLDRLPLNELVMTHEGIASMLGVRREGITEAAGNLQDAGLIHYKRGHITILDRPALEAQSCECYRVVKQEFDRLLPYPEEPKNLPATLKGGSVVLSMSQQFA
jgi:hypothetical protein